MGRFLLFFLLVGSLMRRQLLGAQFAGFVLAGFVISGCGGASHTTPVVPGNSQQSLARAVPLVSPTLTPPPDSGATLYTMHGYTGSKGVYHNPVINGLDGQFSPPVGDTSAGGQGPSLTKFDGIRCQPTMSNNYHVHAFIGLYVNGIEYAIPRGIGIIFPTDPNQLEILTATECFYFTHTHDSTGIVHLEDYNKGVVEKPPTTSHYVTGNIFNTWGITVNANQFGQFAGPVEVFTSGQMYRFLPGTGGVVGENTLTQWTGDPAQIPVYENEVIWYLVGPTYPAALPSIDFAPGY